MKKLIVILTLLSTPVFAQDQTAFLSKALSVLQQQRNAAMDEAANARALSALYQDQVAVLQEQIKKLQVDLDAAKDKLE